eukprot:7654792-Pyramimonas_sp.AAC.1
MIPEPRLTNISNKRRDKSEEIIPEPRLTNVSNKRRDKSEEIIPERPIRTSQTNDVTHQRR